MRNANQLSADANALALEANEIAKGALFWTNLEFWALVATLAATAYAAIAASKAAKAALQSVTVTRTIGEAQVRCYPAIRDVKITFGGAKRGGKVKFEIPTENPHEPAVMPEVAFTVKNYGQSPATFEYTVSIEYFAILHPDNQQPYVENRMGDEKFPIKDKDEFIAQHGEILSAGDEKEYYSNALQLNKFEYMAASSDIENGSLIVRIVIAIAYVDVFKKRYDDARAFHARICSMRDGSVYQMDALDLIFFGFLIKGQQANANASG